MPKIYYPLQDEEVSGIDLLNAVGRYIYDGKAEKRKSGPRGNRLDAGTDPPKKRFVRQHVCAGQRVAILFFTGKGGVGKSTIASTTSVCMAQRGFKTLIVTTDPASHLQEIFGQPIEHEPTRIQGIDNL